MAGRFRFSFPPRRHHDDPWFRVGALDVTTTVLVSLVCVAMLFVWAAQAEHAFIGQLILDPGKVKDGQVWRIVTWPFASNSDANSLGTIIRIAIFWWFGRDIEAQIGRLKFTVMLAFLFVVPGLTATALNVPIGGLRYVELAIFVLYVVEHPGAQFFFGIPGWIIAVVIVGAEVLDLLGVRGLEYLTVLVVSLATGLLVGRRYGLGAEQAWIPHIKMRQRSAKAGRQPRAKGGAGGGQVVVSGPWAGSSPSATADQAEVDRLLDKISAVGMDGLNADEKRRLKEASERLRRERG